MKGRPLESFVGSGTSAMLRLDFGKKGDPQVDGARSSHLLLHRRRAAGAASVGGGGGGVEPPQHLGSGTDAKQEELGLFL